MATKYKRQNDGRFQTKVWDGSYTPSGKKHYITIYSLKSSADLEKRVNAFIMDRDAGKIKVSSNILFLEYACEWRRTYKEIREKGTQAMYDNIIQKHLRCLEGVKLTDIRRSHFQLCINYAAEKPRICQQINITFRQIIKAAISDRLLPAAALQDICDNIDIPKYKPSEKRGLTEIEKAAILTADLTDRERAFIYIAYGCGLRRGEILALTVFDLSMDRAELTVNKSLAFDGNKPYIKGTKSLNGERTVPIPAFFIPFLTQYKKGLTGTLLFENKRGGNVTKSGYRKMWEQIEKKLNRAAGGNEYVDMIPGLTAHVFRHNYCANLCYQMPAISIKKIAYLLGDTEKMVLEVYNHVLDEKEDVQAVVNHAIAL